MEYTTGQTLAGQALTARDVRPSVTEALENEKRQLQVRLQDVEEALATLKAHPDIQKVIDVVSKHTRF